MQIRRATATDAVGILECLAAAFAPYRDRYTPAGFADTTLDRQTIRDRLQSMTLFVAIEGGRIIGTIGCQVVKADEGHLRGMAVLPQRQGSGAARMLLAVAEQELASRGVRRVTLDTTAPLERAAHFYEKRGYRRTGVTADFFGMPLFEFEKIIDPVQQ